MTNFVRRLVPFAFALLLSTPLAGCAKQLQVVTEHSADTDFSQYQTYRWLTDDLILIQSGTGNEAIRNVENEKLIRAAVERELAAKGLEKAEGADAQLVVAFTVGTKVRYKIQGGGASSLDVVTKDSETVTRGRLTLYIFDSVSEQQIWEAWTQKDLSREESPESVINAATAALMAKFPHPSP